MGQTSFGKSNGGQSKSRRASDRAPRRKKKQLSAREIAANKELDNLKYQFALQVENTAQQPRAEAKPTPEPAEPGGTTQNQRSNPSHVESRRSYGRKGGSVHHLGT